MSVKFDPAKEEELSVWIKHHEDYERFKTGLERLRPVFNHFKKYFKENGIKIVTIAGTNGKGETAMRLSNYLVQSGLNVGLWTSPHVLSLSERFVYNGREFEHEELRTAIEESRSLVNDLSYYEYHFHVFCQLMLRQRDLDVIILEVGMGGRLDAVNLFDADLTAVVSISRDHCEYLGNDEATILMEKLGITRQGIPLYTTLEQKSLRTNTAEYCRNHAIPLMELFDSGIVDESMTYSQRNDALARQLAQKIAGKPMPSNSDQKLKARFEEMTLGDRRFIFIGAHNLDGFVKMVHAVDNKNIEQVFVSFSDRQVDEVLNCLEQLNRIASVEKIILCPFVHPKALTAKKWEDVWKAIDKDERLRARFEIREDWHSLFLCTRADSPSDKKSLVCGSYYFIGEFQKKVLALS